jgi:hypothetical protein
MTRDLGPLERGQALSPDIYVFCTARPRCPEVYGNNYVLLLARV